jgi:hypothetical protein
MKKHCLKEIVVVLSLVAGTPLAFADASSAQRESTREMREDRESGVMTAWDTVTTPFRYVGRAGMTVVRTPLIVGETATGEREFISSRGFFTKTPEDARGSAPVNGNEPELSMPIGRGNRIPIRTPQNE